MEKKLAFGLKFSVFNLVIVAILGTLMRYKIAFSLPIVEQKYMQESHSHFAFYGWVTACIYVLIVGYLNKVNPNLNFEKYQRLIIGNFIASYGMLFSFLLDGYKMPAIIFAVMAIFISYLFFYNLIKDFKSVKDQSKNWILGGMFFSVFSSIGIYNLVYMLVSQYVPQDMYLATTYFFLHFQYNGFFIFACLGLLIFGLKEMGIKIGTKENKLIFWLMFIGCLVGYGLSVLWLDMANWIFVLIVIATLMQTVGAVKIYLIIKNNWSIIKQNRNSLQRFMIFYFGLAFGVKIALQLGSNIPAISQFAFGFRNIVIAYLHLILLMCISSFLISRILLSNYFQPTKLLYKGVILFLISVFLNELVLGLMGVFSIQYIAIPKAAEILVIVSALILISSLMMYFGLKRKQI